jgi:hypothetical protein
MDLCQFGPVCKIFSLLIYWNGKSFAFSFKKKKIKIRNIPVYTDILDSSSPELIELGWSIFSSGR